MTLLKKITELLSPSQKRDLFFLAGLILIGMLFELGGLGLIIPIVTMMLKTDIRSEYPSMQPFFEILGNPTQTQIVFGGMFFLVFFYLIKALFLLYLGWRQNRFSREASVHFSSALFLGYLKQPYTFYLQRNSAELLRNLKTEVEMFTSALQAITTISIECSIALGIVLMLVVVEPWGILWVTVFLALSSIGFHRLIRRKLLEWGRERQVHSSLTTQHLMQGIGGVKEIKLAGKENYFLDKYAKHNRLGAKIEIWINTIALIPRLYLEFIAVFALAMFVLTMIMRTQPLELLLPTIGVFAAAAFRIIPSVNRIMGSVQTIRFGQPVVDVLYEEFRLVRHSRENAELNSKLQFKREICVADIQFRYPAANNDALFGLSFAINKGESVGFVGQSGSGKSTLVDIIIGLLPPSFGRVLVDGIDIQTNLRAWQNQIGYVPQTIYLTDDTLRRNVAFGLPDDCIDDEAVWRAIRAAHLEEHIATLPEGLNTLMGERGIRLSGGQRQRIGIARALYHDPEVLVLDEATSSLDIGTEKEVMDAIKALHGDKTILIVAHRLSTIEHCDRVYHLLHGKIEAKDTIFLPKIEDPLINLSMRSAVN